MLDCGDLGLEDGRLGLDGWLDCGRLDGRDLLEGGRQFGDRNRPGRRFVVRDRCHHRAGRRRQPGVCSSIALDRRSVEFGCPQTSKGRLDLRLRRERSSLLHRRLEYRRLDLDRRGRRPGAFRPAHAAWDPGEETVEIREAALERPIGMLSCLDRSVRRSRGLGRDQMAEYLLAFGGEVVGCGHPRADQVSGAPAHLRQIQSRRHIQQIARGQRLELGTGLEQRPGAQVESSEPNLVRLTRVGAVVDPARLRIRLDGPCLHLDFRRLQRTEEAISRVGAIPFGSHRRAVRGRVRVGCRNGAQVEIGVVDRPAQSLDGNTDQQIHDIVVGLAGYLAQERGRLSRQRVGPGPAGLLRELRRLDRRIPTGSCAVPHAAPPGNRNIASSPRPRARPRGVTAVSRSDSSRIRRPARVRIPSEVTAWSSLSA